VILILSRILIETYFSCRSICFKIRPFESSLWGYFSSSTKCWNCELNKRSRGSFNHLIKRFHISIIKLNNFGHLICEVNIQYYQFISIISINIKIWPLSQFLSWFEWSFSKEYKLISNKLKCNLVIWWSIMSLCCVS